MVSMDGKRVDHTVLSWLTCPGRTERRTAGECADAGHVCMRGCGILGNGRMCNACGILIEDWFQKA